MTDRFGPTPESELRSKWIWAERLAKIREAEIVIQQALIAECLILVKRLGKLPAHNATIPDLTEIRNKLAFTAASGHIQETMTLLAIGRKIQNGDFFQAIRHGDDEHQAWLDARIKDLIAEAENEAKF